MLINREFPSTVSEVLQAALGLVQWWCIRTIQFINPRKTIIEPFTKKRDKGLKVASVL
jgi:hypothetical protein